jgi:hypothetical protein
MPRDRTTFRKDLDDGDAPAFVRDTKPDNPVPRCLRCGAEEPARRSLQFLCEYCIDKEQAAKSGTPMARHPGEHGKSFVGRVIASLPDVAKAPKTERDVLRDSEPVQFHAARLRARGIDPDAAMRLAVSLLEDPAHQATCAVCGKRPDLREQLRTQRQEEARQSSEGMSIIGPMLGRTRQRRTGGRP